MGWFKKITAIAVVLVCSGCNATVEDISFFKKSPTSLLTANPITTPTSTPVAATPTPVPATPTPTPNNPTGSTVSPFRTTVPTLLCTKSIGTGSGNIDISQTAQSLKDDDVLCIKAGTYGGLSINKISASAGHTITIQNDGIVNITGSTYGSNFSNLVNVTLSGNGPNLGGKQNGIIYHDLNYRAIQLTGNLQNITFQNLDFINIKDYTIFFPGSLTYNGSTDSLINNVRFYNINGNNLSAGFILFNGNTLLGLSQNVEIAYCNVDTAVFFAGLNGSFKFNVHHNIVRNINLGSNTHQGIILTQGDGEVHHNYINNVLGEAVRAWPNSLGTRGKLNIYNNIFLNSIKYSPIEIQTNTPTGGGFTSTQSAYFTNSDYHIYNNTAGNINLCGRPTNPAALPGGPECWYGALVDTYSSDGGVLTIENNIIFSVYGINRSDPIVNNEGNLLGNASTVVRNNLAFDSAAQAGMGDDIFVKPQLGSVLIGAGTSIGGLTNDFYGTARTTPLDIGAVQH